MSEATPQEQYGEVKYGGRIPMHCAVEPEKTREAALLGLKLIDWHLGSLHHSIAEVLNAHGRLNLKELVEQVCVMSEEDKRRGVSAEAVKAALVTLIRHNCVVVHEWKSVDVPGRPKRGEFLFELDMPRTLNLLRLPLFSLVLETTVPRKQVLESRVVMQALWNDGRLGLDALVTNSVNMLKARWKVGQDLASGGEDDDGDNENDNKEDQEEKNEDGDNVGAARRTLNEHDARLQSMTDEELVEHMRSMVNDLINRQLIEKAPACTLSPPEDFVHVNAQKKKSSKDPEGEDQVKENDLRVHGQAVREHHSINRFVRQDTWGDPSRNVYSVTDGPKHYHVQMCLNRPQDDVAVNIAAEDQIWRVNFQELNRRVYNGIAVETIRTGLESIEDIDPETCGRVVEAMLYATKNPLPWHSNHASVVPIMKISDAMSISTIRHASGEIHEVPLENAEIENVINAMLKDSKADAKDKPAEFEEYFRIAKKSQKPHASTSKDADENKRKRKAKDANDAPSNATPSTPKLEKRRLPPLSSCLLGDDDKKLYRFDTPTALYIARTAKLLEIIEQRFGPHGKRIWNMLYTEGQMEQKSVSSDSMLGNTRPREILYAMFRNGFVALQDIPRNADRAPSRTFYTWRATIAAAITTTAVMLYKSASNILQMLQDIMTSDELHDITKRMGMGIGFEEDILGEIHFKKDVLVDNLLMLDEEIALFQFARDSRGGDVDSC